MLIDLNEFKEKNKISEEISKDNKKSHAEMLKESFEILDELDFSDDIKYCNRLE